MISEKTIEIINKVVSKETFKYTGEIISGVDIKADIDYKFRITGHRKMMSVGEYYDYLLLEVVITGVHDSISKVLFDPAPTEEGKIIAKSFENQLYKFYSDLNRDIQDYLKYFNDSGKEFIRTTIDDLRFDLKSSKNIEESSKLNFGNNKNLRIFVSNIKNNLKQSLLESKMSRMSKIAVRTTVTDIVNIIKKSQEGDFYLPGENGEEYSFNNLPFKYSVELTLKIDNNLDKFEINGNYSSEDDVIEIIVKYNPKTLKRNFYNIIGELNDIVAHELEHGFQYITEGKRHKVVPTDSFEYYTQPDEIKAQRVGFRRVAKLRKLPYIDVVNDWFEDHKDIHGLTDDEMKKVIHIIINGK
jgi:hypothetical protein